MLDLARHDSRLKAVGSFHGVLTPSPVTPDSSIAAKIAVYHGWRRAWGCLVDLLAETFGRQARRAGAQRPGD